MKKLLVLFLAFTMCISLLIGCGEKSNPADNDQNSNNTGVPNVSDNDKPDVSEENNDNSNNDNNGNGGATQTDILEGLPYTIKCIDKYTQEDAEYQFTDNGRLNDGLYRSEVDLENEANSDMRVDFDGTSSYNFQIVFEADGNYENYRLIAHNCDFRFTFLSIEVGSDLDNMTEVEFEEDNEITANMHTDNYADFKANTIKTIRITLTTGTSSYTSFDEFTLLGFSGDGSYIPDPSIPETSEPTDGEKDNRLIGTWGADDPEIVEKGGSDYKVVITFVSNGTGTYLQAGAELPFTWYTVNDVLYMDVALAGELEKPYYFQDGNLYMNDEDGRLTKFVKL